MNRSVFLVVASLVATVPVVAEDARNPVGALVPLTVSTPSGPRTYEVETVSTERGRALGLMFRTELPERRGMFFDFGQERPVAFWMRNTLVPLDMVFAKASGDVVRVHAHAVPMDETPVPSGAPVRFVLELPAGEAERDGIVAGARIELPPR